MVKLSLLGKTAFLRLALVALIGLPFVAVLFSSCEFLALNIMPSYLSRVEGSVDLESALKKAGLGASFRVKKLSFVSSGGHDYAVAVATDDAQLANAFVDLDGMTVQKVLIGSGAGDTVLADMDGYIATGTSWNTNLYRYYPSSMALYSGPSPITNTFGNDVSSLIESGTQYLIWVSGSYVYMQPYTSTWSSGTLLSPYIDSDYSLSGNKSSTVMDGSSVRLLLVGGSSSFVMTFSSFATFLTAMQTAPILGNSGVSYVTLPSSDDESGWMTRGGAILLHHDNGTTLTLYDSDSGEELDSFPIDDSENSAYGFSPDGTKWLLYDGASGKLHLLRTWW